MPSEDSKPLTKNNSVEDDEDRSLSSMLKDGQKKPTNSSSTKPRPKVTKVKKEELEDDDFEKPIKASINGSRLKLAKIKKEERQDEDDDDDKPISKSSKLAKPKKEDKKDVEDDDEKYSARKISNNKADRASLTPGTKATKKRKRGEEKQAQAGNKKEKKVYSLPGQKRDPPEARDPMRIFYESLYKQIPSSEMAQIWMMESGLLAEEEAWRVYEKKQKKKQQQRVGTPTKTPNREPVTAKKKNLSPTDPSNKKKTADSKAALKHSKKRKTEDESTGDDSDDDFIIGMKRGKQ